MLIMIFSYQHTKQNTKRLKTKKQHNKINIKNIKQQQDIDYFL